MARFPLKKALSWLVFALLLAFAAYKLHSSRFDWAGFAASWRTADFRLIALASFVVLTNYVFRAVRWAVFLRPAFRATGIQPVAWWGLIGSQLVGFTGLAIFGRIGELIRPLLVSRRTGLTFSSQIAVVAVERVFDLGAFGLIFSLNLLLNPVLRRLPYLHKAGYAIGGLTVAIGVFVAVVRLAGASVARAAETVVGVVSKPAGAAFAKKILAFRDGLNVIDSFVDFLLAACLSLATWSIIALTYLLTLKSFPAPVSDLTLGYTIVLMGFSIAGSALPIPGGSGGWAGNVFALTNLLGIPAALAAAAGLIVWLVTNLSVIPFGLLYARIEGISLRQAADEKPATRRAPVRQDTRTCRIFHSNEVSLLWICPGSGCRFAREQGSRFHPAAARVRAMQQALYHL